MPCGRPVPLQRRAVRSIARTGMTTTAAIRGVLIASAIPWVCLMTSGAEAQTLRAIETDPPAGAVLAEREQLYVRLAYTSRGPVRFDVEGWLDGRAVRAAATSIQPEYPAGDGETLVWLAYRDPTRVDELRVRKGRLHGYCFQPRAKRSIRSPRPQCPTAIHIHQRPQHRAVICRSEIDHHRPLFARRRQFQSCFGPSNILLYFSSYR